MSLTVRPLRLLMPTSTRPCELSRAAWAASASKSSTVRVALITTKVSGLDMWRGGFYILCYNYSTMTAVSSDKPSRVAVVGAGPRSIAYTREASQPSSPMKVVAVADPDAVRRNRLADAHAVREDCRFASYEELV